MNVKYKYSFCTLPSLFVLSTYRGQEEEGVGDRIPNRPRHAQHWHRRARERDAGAFAAAFSRVSVATESSFWWRCTLSHAEPQAQKQWASDPDKVQQVGCASQCGAKRLCSCCSSPRLRTSCEQRDLRTCCCSCCQSCRRLPPLCESRAECCRSARSSQAAATTTSARFNARGGRNNRFCSSRRAL